MGKIKTEYIEKIYAGWLAKIIGIRLGAPIEGWSYEKIKNIYGELNHYPVDYKEFAADDDSNGPLFFLKALEDSKKGSDLQAQDVAEALLNYAPFEHGFFWWGGYGVSTEHTAYLNLKNGMQAPRSGSIAQNGHAAAEQIGGQIFIDTWGLVTPGNPDLAARFAEKAASVTHDGNGIYGGIFVAVCISYAFVENDIRKIIEKGLSYIPTDCEYTKVVRTVMTYAESNPSDWRSCYQFIFENYGYDKYPGNCHIIPNIAVMILALMYGEGDFSKTLNICNMCGWDTDCNVGNIAAIMGVRGGLQAIDYEKWRKPVNDFLACSSVVGSLNIMDIPFGASYITKLAWNLAGEELPKPWKEIIEEKIDSCHFEYPGCTHAIRVRKDLTDGRSNQQMEYELINTDETAATGNRSLKLMVKPVYPGENIYAYKKTYYRPCDFHDSRYDPSFSPLVYPGQTIHGSAYIPQYAREIDVCLYALEAHSDKVYKSKSVHLNPGCWETLSYEIPSVQGGLVSEIGFCFSVLGIQNELMEFVGMIDDLYADGNPNYTMEANLEEEEVWTGIHREISQFTKLKGLMYLDEGQLNLSCSDFAEAYTGRYDWKDYCAKFYMTPLMGKHHLVNVRVQGAIRSYAAGFLPDGKIGLLKNKNGYEELVSREFAWTPGSEYKVEICVNGNNIKAVFDDTVVLEYIDEKEPYLEGAIGISVLEGSHCKLRKIVIS